MCRCGGKGGRHGGSVRQAYAVAEPARQRGSVPRVGVWCKVAVCAGTRRELEAQRRQRPATSSEGMCGVGW